MSSIIRHSSVIAGSAFLFGELGSRMGEKAARFNYSGNQLPITPHFFESLGRLSGSYIGTVVALGGILLAHCNSENKPI